MYGPDDTIVAVSSPPGGFRSIIRISGPDALRTCCPIFTPSVDLDPGRIIAGRLAADEQLAVPATLYAFGAPNSFTGQTVVELHIEAGKPVVSKVIENLLSAGLRPAGPGEFTARAYLNGKLDLAQAEAVNEIIVTSNSLQLAAAQKLLAGRLAETTEAIRSALLDCLSLVEAGLDFSEEQIESVTTTQIVKELTAIRAQLQQLLAGSIRYESIIDLPSIGVAGAPNAGKSSLVNALLGTERSIVSEKPKTTRDVLTGLLELPRCRCVIFDCAGLIAEPADILDQLAQQAAIEALRHSSVVVFCVDSSKPDCGEDVAVRGMIETAQVVPVATKADLLAPDDWAGRSRQLGSLFCAQFTPTSVVTGAGLDTLRIELDSRIIETSQPTMGRQRPQDTIALTARHKQAVTDAIECSSEAIAESHAGNEEVVAMLIRSAYRAVSHIEQEHVDEKVLDRIFSRFCIGK